MLDSNAAECAIRNTPAVKEKLPFDTWQQIEAVAANRPVYGPMVVFRRDRAQAIGALRT